MSYTHTLSIQGVHASLQMNVEHSAVQYTLTLRADSGEEVVANGHLPNDAVDQFTVINQYVTNPREEKKTSEQSLKDHIITDLFDFISQGQVIQENQQNQPKTDRVESHDSLETERISPIMPSNHLSLKDSEQSGKPLIPELEVHDSFSELAIMKQLQHLRQYSGPDIKLGIIQAVQQYLSEHNINIRDYCMLCEYMKELFYEMIVLHIHDNVVVDKFIEMLYLVGEKPCEVNEYKKTMSNQYALFCKIAAYHAITLDSASFAAYQAWKKTYHGYSLNRFHLMKMFLESQL